MSKALLILAMVFLVTGCAQQGGSSSDKWFCRAKTNQNQGQSTCHWSLPF